MIKSLILFRFISNFWKMALIFSKHINCLFVAMEEELYKLWHNLISKVNFLIRNVESHNVILEENN